MFTAWAWFIARFIITIAPVNIARKTDISVMPTTISISEVPASPRTQRRRAPRSLATAGRPARREPLMSPPPRTAAETGPIPAVLVAVTVKV